jgi:hypothetical protein
VEKLCIAGQAIYDNISGRMRFACYTTKATNTQSEYVILNDFPLQQWLQESISMLRYSTLLSCFVHASNTDSGLSFENYCIVKFLACLSSGD